jgi:hypothetical protein
MSKLDPESLSVQSFATAESSDPSPRCCTGCDSGCGINPTAGGCESQPNTFGEYTCDCGTVAA